MKIESVAAICHNANTTYRKVRGEGFSPYWGYAPEDQRDSAINGVKHALQNPDVTPEAMHESWMEHKLKSGWTYGDVKDDDMKTHPCLVPYDRLPEMQRAKDHLFLSIVRALAPFITENYDETDELIAEPATNDENLPAVSSSV